MQVVLEPAAFVGGLRGDRGAGRRSGGRVRGRGHPGAGAEDSSSGSELEPSRLAPLMLTQATSPAA